MGGQVNHDYHILEPDIWPLAGSLSALAFTSGMVLNFYPDQFGIAGPVVMWAGLAGLIATFFMWFKNIVVEAQQGDHTPIVQLHMRYGMILFIASEVMFFVGWFWAFFDFSLFPAPLEFFSGEGGDETINRFITEGETALGSRVPEGMEVLDAFQLPLLNTIILLCSGTTVTWAHHALIHGDRDGLKQGLWATIGLGVIFSFIQAYEYSVAPFSFGGNTFSSAFYMATGFHGFHVVVGTIFLGVCLYRAYLNHFTPRQHFGFEAAAWYWHFVDVVWLFLFVSIYVWGGWGAPVH